MIARVKSEDEIEKIISSYGFTTYHFGFTTGLYKFCGKDISVVYASPSRYGHYFFKEGTMLRIHSFFLEFTSYIDFFNNL